MIDTEHKTPACVRCANCYPSGNGWKCCSEVNTSPEYIDEPLLDYGNCHSFMYRTTRILDDSEE